MELQGGLNLDFITKKFSFEKAAKCHNPLYKKENNKQGFLLEGSGGSGKTIDALQFILYYCQENKNKGKDILITRKTNTELVKTTLKDFIKVLSWYGFYNQKNHFKSHPQHYNFKGNIIYFSGMDAEGSHGERHDLIYGNEALEFEQFEFQQLNQRCNEGYILDWNPSTTDHWIFNSLQTRPDTQYFHSIFKDNYFLPAGQYQELSAYEPTAENIANGTADDYMWKVYGLGLRSAPKGLIFQNVTWIDEFPKDIKYVFGLDFGFTNDKTALTKVGLEGNNLYIELLFYEPIDNSPALSEVLFSLELNGLKQGIRITADCSDKYNDTEMVKELKNLGHNIYKVNKGKGISWRIGMLKKHKIHLIRDVNLKREQENYKWREINGICINEPIDKWNHAFDSAGYAYIGGFLNSGIIMHG